MGTGLGYGIWEVRGVPTPFEASEKSNGEGEEAEHVELPASPTAQANPGLRSVTGELAGTVDSGIEVTENQIQTPETPPGEGMDEDQTICEDC